MPNLHDAIKAVVLEAVSEATPAIVDAVVAALGKDLNADAPPPPAAKPTKKKRASKKTPTTTPAPVVEAEVVDDLGLGLDEDTSEPLTLDDVIAKARTVAEADGGRDKIIAAVTKLGVTKIPDVPADKFAEFMELIS